MIVVDCDSQEYEPFSFESDFEATQIVSIQRCS